MDTLTTTVSAPDITCDGCANAIRRALGQVPGVSNVNVNIDAKTVTIAHTDDAPAPTLITALDDAGFPATLTN